MPSTMLDNATQEPASPAAWQIALGLRLQQKGDLHGAVECYRDALTLDPRSHTAYNQLGILFAALGDTATALTFLQAAVTLHPRGADIHNNLGNVHFEREEVEAAIAHYVKAIEIDPEVAAYYNHLGNALRVAERIADAELCIRKALVLHPDYAEAHANLGFLLLEKQRLQLAEEHYRQAIALKPDFALAHTCLARLLLRKGDFAAGWREQEWRWLWKDFPTPKRNFTQPQWRGEDVRAQRLFLHAEQGFGDTLQFLRYVPMAAARGAEVILEVHPELRRLAERMPGVSQVISRGDVVPAFDRHCPLLSLPLAFGTELATIPAATPYLQAGTDVPEWVRREDGKFRVGLVWAGSPKDKVDRKRSLALPALAPLFAAPGVAFYSLQCGSAAEEARNSALAFAGQLPESSDFADTAAAVAHLDLVISADTAVAHLAGALGKPVWVLLPSLADWRWLTDREDSPWYPSARLFRQQTAGDWGPVVDQVADQLSLAAVTARVLAIR
jgi:Flp pilus assembly protein TadD